MAKFTIDIAVPESIFTLEINREIFIPNREVGRFSLLRKQIGRSPAKSGGLEALHLRSSEVIILDKCGLKQVSPGHWHCGRYIVDKQGVCY